MGKDKKTICVITSAPSVKNYGAYLQAYATVKLFESNGYNVFLINYKRHDLLEATELKEIEESLKYRNYTKKLPSVLRNLTARILFPSIKKLNQSFAQFSNMYFMVPNVVYKEECDLINKLPPADIYCTGGDQMWNEEFNGHKTLREYYLSFAPEDKIKISFSTSIGKYKFDDWEKPEVEKLLKKYNMITVREDTAVKAIKELGIENVKHLQDPTLLLDVQEWDKICDTRRIREPYILIYEISRKSSLGKYAKMLKKISNFKVIRISYFTLESIKYGKSIVAPSLEEFVSLIKYADFVITNSFHGTAFSIIYKKNFVSVPGANPDRLKSVLKYYGLERRLCRDTSSVLQLCNESIDYSKIDLGRENAQITYQNFMRDLNIIIAEGN